MAGGEVTDAIKNACNSQTGSLLGVVPTLGAMRTRENGHREAGLK